MRTSEIIIFAGFLVISLTAYAEEGKSGAMAGTSVREGQKVMKTPDTMVEQEQMRAEAQLYDGQGIHVGEVLFTQENNGVKVAAEINNMPEGIHALHIHETGQCQASDFKSSGGHFNPFGKQHGFLNQKGPHAGDLPNIEVEENGKGKMTVTTNYLTLTKGEVNSLLKDGGTAVVIHQGPDDYISDPAGGGGPRIACGVIEEIE